MLLNQCSFVFPALRISVAIIALFGMGLTTSSALFAIDPVLQDETTEEPADEAKDEQPAEDSQEKANASEDESKEDKSSDDKPKEEAESEKNEKAEAKTDEAGDKEDADTEPEMKKEEGGKDDAQKDDAQKVDKQADAKDSDAKPKKTDRKAGWNNPLPHKDSHWPDYPLLEWDATGEWWKPKVFDVGNGKKRTVKPRLVVPRDEVIAFAIYAHDRDVLKLTAQLYPLKPDESREVRLEFKRDDEWQEAAKEEIVFPGWSAHFRMDDWDNTENVEYRIRHGEKAQFTGLIRRDPIDKPEIVVGNLSCNSSRTPGPRPKMIANLKKLDPDVLFFAGDQSYHHANHTFGWIEFGVQFRDILRDRPAITIPDDHDVGQANIWGESGKKAATPQGPQGGYYYPAGYVNMVQRCQTWHLPEPYDATPIGQEISVYYTNLRVGGVDFAIIEDRKFKSGPEGKIPKMGPRPDHINDPKYDRAAIDLDDLVLLGDRQLKFLNVWSADWTGAKMKCVLSQTAFCGAVHLHGKEDNRLLADLDCNGWPQKGRNKALTEIRRAWAPHLCGDQHLAVVVKHGIDRSRDGPYSFTSPAIVNTIYGRWWHPADEKAGKDPLQDTGLPWTGDYEDGLGNLITMMAYANPPDVKDEKQRGDGFGICRFDKTKNLLTIECWPRFADVDDGDEAQFDGWPITVRMEDNDGRVRVGYLPEIRVEGADRPVIQVIQEETGEVLYTVRAGNEKFRPPVYAEGKYTVKVGVDKPDGKTVEGLEVAGSDEEFEQVTLDEVSSDD